MAASTSLKTGAALDQSKFVITGPKAGDADLLVRPTITYWQDAWRRLRKNPIAMTALVVLTLLVLMTIVGPYIRGYDFVAMNPVDKNQGASMKYWFGTDALGRDMFSRIWYGARASILVALVATLLKVVVGSAYGGIMAYFGGWVDEVMMRVIEVMTSVPSLLITILMMLVMGNSMFSLLLAMSITAWCSTARQMRGLILQLRHSEYVMAAEMLDASPLRIITKHYIPNTLSILILDIAVSIPGFIFTEAGLSFLGIGLQPPDTSLGVLISTGQQTMEFYPSQLFYPALVLCLIVLAFNLLGDGLRDALDPRMRQ